MFAEAVNWYRKDDWQAASDASLHAGASDGTPLFSFLTLVSNYEKYDAMVRSFLAAGFDTTACRFHAVDNTDGNILDGYSALHVLSGELTGKYIVFAHDDVEAMTDTFATLVDIIEQLEKIDPNWLIAGNAGYKARRTGDYLLKAHVNDPHGNFRIDSACEVQTLDENFLVLKNGLRPSLDLSGFHLFATDMCLLARIAGGSAYVIPFLLNHNSGGGRNHTFFACRDALEEKYTALGMTADIRTPSTRVFIGKHRRQRRFLSERRKSLDGFLSRRKQQIRAKIAQ